MENEELENLKARLSNAETHLRFVFRNYRPFTPTEESYEQWIHRVEESMMTSTLPEVPCPACCKEDEVVCSRCTTCRGEGWVQGHYASYLVPMGLVFFAFGVGLMLYIIIAEITNWARP